MKGWGPVCLAIPEQAPIGESGSARIVPAYLIGQFSITRSSCGNIVADF